VGWLAAAHGRVPGGRPSDRRRGFGGGVTSGSGGNRTSPLLAPGHAVVAALASLSWSRSAHSPVIVVARRRWGTASRCLPWRARVRPRSTCA